MGRPRKSDVAVPRAESFGSNLKPCDRCDGRMEVDTSGDGIVQEKCRTCGEIRAPRCNVPGCLGIISRGRCAACEARAAWKRANMPMFNMYTCEICKIEAPRARGSNQRYCPACGKVVRAVISAKSKLDRKKKIEDAISV